MASGSDSTVTWPRRRSARPGPGYQPTAPPPLPRSAALACFAGAGYPPEAPGRPAVGRRAGPAGTDDPEPTRGRISKDGKPLSLVIGVAANDPTAVAVANTAADQLRSVGIAASVSALDPWCSTATPW